MQSEKLPVLRIVSEAYLTPFLELSIWARVAVVPFCLYFASGFVIAFVDAFVAASSGRAPEVQTPWSLWNVIATAFQFFFGTIFATAWHRYVLLDPKKVKVRTSLGIDLGKREFWFFVYALIYLSILMGPYYFSYYFGTTVLAVRLFFGLEYAVAWLVLLFLWWPVYMSPFITRFVLVLPAAAVERQISFFQSWSMTHGFVWRVWAIVILCGLPAPVLTRFVFSPLAERAQGHLLWVTTVELTWLIVAFVEIVIAATGVSLTYRWVIKRNEPGG